MRQFIAAVVLLMLASCGPQGAPEPYILFDGIEVTRPQLGIATVDDGVCGLVQVQVHELSEQAAEYVALADQVFEELAMPSRRRSEILQDKDCILVFLMHQQQFLFFTSGFGQQVRYDFDGITWDRVDHTSIPIADSAFGPLDPIRGFTMSDGSIVNFLPPQFGYMHESDLSVLAFRLSVGQVPEDSERLIALLQEFTARYLNTFGDEEIAPMVQSGATATHAFFMISEDGMPRERLEEVEWHYAALEFSQGVAE